MCVNHVATHQTYENPTGPTTPTTQPEWPVGSGPRHLEAKRENFGVLAPEAKTQVAPLHWGEVVFFGGWKKPPVGKVTLQWKFTNICY